MKAQHTQEDWRIGTNGTGSYAIFNKDYQIAQISAFKQGISEEEVKSNAKLIASAPELLKRLTDLVNWLHSKEHDEQPGFSMSMAKELIKKLTV